MPTTAHLLVYTIDLDPLMARAIAADLPGARIGSFPSLRAAIDRGAAHRPDVVLLYLFRSDASTAVASIRAAWGDQVVLVGLDRRAPCAHVWCMARAAETVELGPDFLARFLPA